MKNKVGNVATEKIAATKFNDKKLNIEEISSKKIGVEKISAKKLNVEKIGIEKIFNYEFKNKDLLNSALSHSSAQKIKTNFDINFEHLEFIGDRVLSLSITQLLFEKIDKKDAIKNLAFKHAEIVSTENLAAVAKKLGIEKYLKHSIETVSHKVAADFIEAIIGAIYLDSSCEEVYLAIKSVFDISYTITLNPKMQLQEFAQSKKIPIPIYETISISGPDHRKIYKMSVQLFSKIPKEDLIAQGIGNSKHAATIDAAKNLLKKLGLN